MASHKEPSVATGSMRMTLLSSGKNTRNLKNSESTVPGDMLLGSPEHLGENTITYLDFYYPGN